jgi:bifunctional UDP-N-acetylglucosamine pyrophosphorylase/glucosamine-1-phosphate N-acetyltransferase
MTNEFYLTDLLEILLNNNIEISIIKSNTYWPFHGINTMQDLAIAEDIAQNQLRKKFMQNGVKLLAPQSVYFTYDTEIESDVVIEQNVVIGPNVKIKKYAEIKSFSYIEHCEIMENVSVGPFARIRGNTKLLPMSSVGNFVEIKGTTFGKAAKAKHLSYIGDTEVGQNSNIGAGVITCNYDGVKKHKTIIGDNTFVGSNSTLIAPVEIGDDVIVAAGSVIDHNAPRGSLAISRVKQDNIPDKAKQIWQKKGRK